MYKLLIADDHRVLRMGLKMLLNSQADFSVVGEASNGREVLDFLKNNKDIDIVVLDISMPDMSGIECLRQIRQKEYPVKVLMLTMHKDSQYIKEVMLLGANGYLTKDALDKELFQALRQIGAGQRYLDEKDAMILLNTLIDEPKDNVQLSAREKEVLIYIAKGYPLGQIADMLNLSVKTISTYKTRLMTKLNCQQNQELVEYARKNKFV